MQLVFEIAIENGEEALKMLGMPIPGEHRWCAIALLDLKPKPAEAKESEANGSPKKSWQDYTFAQQSFLLCRDPDFQRYFEAKDEAGCIAKLKSQLRIESRSEIGTGTDAGTRWLEVVALYRLHRDRLK